jgi:hypothetical protein
MDAPKTISPVSVLCRLTWMLLGPLGLVLCAIGLARARSGFPSAADAAYLAVLGLMLLARWQEFRGGDPRTASGEPATPRHLRRYLLVAGFLGMAIWAGLHALPAL